MKVIKGIFGNFTIFEWILWIGSLIAILLSAILCGGADWLYVIGALIGATALIFVAKGNVIGQILTVVFSVFYGIASFSFAYYGEMITYLGMTTPMAIAAVVTWLKNPYKEGENEVKVNKITGKEYAFSILLAFVVSIGFYFILWALNTQNLIISTISVFTSFMAVYLTMRRSEFYAVAYACNDVVLIILWALATAEDIKYLSMLMCFIVFLLNDLYGFINWRQMRKKQQRGK